MRSNEELAVELEIIKAYERLSGTGRRDLEDAITALRQSQRELAELRAQRDELLTALEMAEARFTFLAQNSQPVVEELKAARAAIAKSGGTA